MKNLRKYRNVAMAAAFVAGLVWIGALTVATAADGDDFEYVGSKKCKMCHKDAYKSWEATTHAKAFEILKPGERSGAKEKYGLDSAKDYTTDESCLACHTTGFGKKGGYAVPDPADEKAAKKMAKLEGAGCECCHGPGKEYAKLHKEIRNANKGDKKGTRKYKPEEMYAVGMTKIEEATCACCHNDKSPTFEAGKTLDFEKMTANEAAIHAHQELELREG